LTVYSLYLEFYTTQRGGLTWNLEGNVVHFDRHLPIFQGNLLPLSHSAMNKKQQAQFRLDGVFKSRIQTSVSDSGLRSCHEHAIRQTARITPLPRFRILNLQSVNVFVGETVSSWHRIVPNYAFWHISFTTYETLSTDFTSILQVCFETYTTEWIVSVYRYSVLSLVIPRKLVAHAVLNVPNMHFYINWVLFLLSSQFKLMWMFKFFIVERSILKQIYRTRWRDNRRETNTKTFDMSEKRLHFQCDSSRQKVVT
jgi:hypothetical protein